MQSALPDIYGAKRIRTADPLNAIEVRYQLRYSPRTTTFMLANLLACL